MNLIQYVYDHQAKASIIAISNGIAGFTISKINDYHIPAIILETLQGCAYAVSITVGLITIGTWIYKKLQ